MIPYIPVTVADHANPVCSKGEIPIVFAAITKANANTNLPNSMDAISVTMIPNLLPCRNLYMNPLIKPYAPNSSIINGRRKDGGIPVIKWLITGEINPTAHPNTGPKAKPPIKTGMCIGRNNSPGVDTPGMWNACGRSTAAAIIIMANTAFLVSVFVVVVIVPPISYAYVMRYIKIIQHKNQIVKKNLDNLIQYGYNNLCILLNKGN